MKVLNSTTVVHYPLHIGKARRLLQSDAGWEVLEKYIGSNMVQVKTVTGRFDASWFLRGGKGVFCSLDPRQWVYFKTTVYPWYLLFCQSSSKNSVQPCIQIKLCCYITFSNINLFLAVAVLEVKCTWYLHSFSIPFAKAYFLISGYWLRTPHPRRPRGR